MSESQDYGIKIGEVAAFMSVVPGPIEIFDVQNSFSQILAGAHINTAAEFKGTADLWNTYSRAAEQVSSSIHMVRIFDMDGNWVKFCLMHRTPNLLERNSIDIDVLPDGIARLRQFYGTDITDQGLFPEPYAICATGRQNEIVVRADKLTLVIRDEDNIIVSQPDRNYTPDSIKIGQKLLIDVVPSDADREAFVGAARRTMNAIRCAR